MSDNNNNNTYSFVEKELENIICRAFDAGVCYGASLVTIGDRYPRDYVIRFSKELLRDCYGYKVRV